MTAVVSNYVEIIKSGYNAILNLEETEYSTKIIRNVSDLWQGEYKELNISLHLYTAWSINEIGNGYVTAILLQVQAIRKLHMKIL